MILRKVAATGYVRFNMNGKRLVSGPSNSLLWAGTKRRSLSVRSSTTEDHLEDIGERRPMCLQLVLLKIVLYRRSYHLVGRHLPVMRLGRWIRND